MSTQSLPTGKEKITVSLPQELAERLRQHVPARKRDAFIVHALQEQLALEEQLKVLEETAGAWKDADHPELATGADIDLWLEQLRGSWPDRLARLQEGR
jgi:Arc/MetJ-type ribon-helix-helix transcriptional regulator